MRSSSYVHRFGITSLFSNELDFSRNNARNPKKNLCALQKLETCSHTHTLLDFCAFLLSMMHKAAMNNLHYHVCVFIIRPLQYIMTFIILIS